MFVDRTGNMDTSAEKQIQETHQHHARLYTASGSHRWLPIIMVRPGQPSCLMAEWYQTRPFYWAISLEAAQRIKNKKRLRNLAEC